MRQHEPASTLHPGFIGRGGPTCAFAASPSVVAACRHAPNATFFCILNKKWSTNNDLILLSCCAAARAQRPGWEARWGHEEVSRPGGTVSAAETNSPATAEAAAASASHPAYAGEETSSVCCFSAPLEMLLCNPVICKSYG